MSSLLRVNVSDERLDRLLQLYMYEWTALLPRSIGADARYQYDELPDYADRDRHAAYLFVDGEELLGFALTAQDEDDVWHVEEFFVLHAARRRGVGRTLARQVFATRPGPWTLTVRPENPAALAFWRRVLPDAHESPAPGADGITRLRMRFDARAALT